MDRGRAGRNEMKNHEGYHDPTAGKAIKEANRKRKRHRLANPFSDRLTYQLREIPGFSVILD